MNYLTVEQARARKALRLVLCAGTPGVWGEAIKAVLHHKNIDYLPVIQEVGGENRSLREWTGQTSAPVIVDADDQLHISWESMVLLADRLAPDRPLIPVRAEERVTMFGLLREIAGESGIGWNRRLQSIANSGGPSVSPVLQRLADKYGYSEAAVANSQQRTAEILGLLSSRLAEFSPYYFGEQLTALDFYSAIFLGVMFDPLPAEVVPMPDMMRAGFADSSSLLRDAFDERLRAHRDRMFAEHIATPLDF